MSYVADHSGRSSAYGSYKPVQVGMQPHEGMPTCTTFDAASHSSLHERAFSAEWSFALYDSFDFHEADKSAECDEESCAEEGWLDGDKFGARRIRVRGEDYTFSGVDLKPVLPVALCCLNCDWWPVHAPGADSDVVLFHHPIAGVALCTFCGGLWHCLGVHGVSWRIAPLLIVGKSKRRETWKLVLLVAWTLRRGCRGVRTSRGNIPVLSAAMIISVLSMVAKCHRSSQSPWICDNGGRFAIDWSAWDHRRHLACHLDRWEGMRRASLGLRSLWRFIAVALLAIDGPIFKIHFGLILRNEMAQEWKKNEHYVANNTRIGDNVPVEDLEDDEYNELFDRDAFVYDRQGTLLTMAVHQLPELLVRAPLDFASEAQRGWCEGGVKTSHCYSCYACEPMCMGFTAVTKRSVLKRTGDRSDSGE